MEHCVVVIDLILSGRIERAVKPDVAVAAALASRAVPDNMDAITSYISRVPPEFSVLTIKDTQRRNPQCMMTKAFVQWANKNASLLG